MNIFFEPGQQYTLNLEATESRNRLSDYWVEKLQQDSLFMAVVESKAFARLKKISFLGAIDYLPYEKELNKGPRSRAEHSIHVAALAGFVAKHRGYNQDLTRHLIVAGLLHDIGHPPLSHSIEPYLKKNFGFGHHEMGQMLLRGQHKISKNLYQTLKNEVDIDFIDQLIAGQVPSELGGDLFSSPINIDTIDGILRAFSYYNRSSSSIRPLDVAYASFISSDNNRFDILDAFWATKDFVYRNIVNRKQGVLADQFSQIYFMRSVDHALDETSLFENEAQWSKKYNGLFDQLSRLNLESDSLIFGLEESVVFSERNYYIDRDLKNISRFKSKKIKKKVVVFDLCSGVSNKIKQSVLDFG